MLNPDESLTHHLYLTPLCRGHLLFVNKTLAKAFTPPAKTKMITRPGRAVTSAFIGGVVDYFCSVQRIPFKSVIIRVPSKAF